MIVGVENRPLPRIGERDESSPSHPPLGVPLRFSETVLSFAPDKRPENIPDSIEIVSGQQKLHTHTFRSASAKDSHICREILAKKMASFVGGRFTNERTLKTNGALLRLLEGSLKIASNLQRLMQKESLLKRGGKII